VRERSYEDSLEKDSGYSVRVYNLPKGLVLNGNNVRVVIPKKKRMIREVDGIRLHGFNGFYPIGFLGILKNLVVVRERVRCILSRDQLLCALLTIWLEVLALSYEG
jgi:hypothetical protein